MTEKLGRYLLLVIIILILTSSLPIINAQSEENIKVTGVTVYRVYPFRPNDVYNIESIFFKNYSYKNYSLDLPWSSPFSFKPSQISNILEKLNNNSYVTSDSINVYFKDESSKNEYIEFSLVDSNYNCIIFPTMIIGINDLTDTNEYISLSEMNARRNEFLEVFENFIMEKPGFQFNLQQEEFLTGESLPRESMIWTRIIRVTQNFNTFSNEQIWDYLFYNLNSAQLGNMFVSNRPSNLCTFFGTSDSSTLSPQSTRYTLLYSSSKSIGESLLSKPAFLIS